MSRYYGNLEGSRGDATRMGTTASGFQASARSYNGSATVYLHAAPDTIEKYKGGIRWDGTRYPGGTQTVAHDWLNITIGEGSTVGGRAVFTCDVREAVKKAEAGYVLRWVKPRK